MITYEAFALAANEEVSCGLCMERGRYDSYRRGQAVLAEAGHAPCDGNCHYICMGHLMPSTVISDPEDHFKTLTISEYEALAPSDQPGWWVQTSRH